MEQNENKNVNNGGVSSAFSPLSLLGGLGDLAGGVFGSIMNYRSQKKANEANIRMMHENQAWQEKMMHLQNAYNSPAQQMLRLSKAGLNPNLIYGQMGDQTSASPQAVEQPTLYPENIGDVGSAFSGAIQTSLDKSLEYRYKQEEIRGLEIQNNIKSKELGNYDRYILNLNRQFDDIHNESVEMLAKIKQDTATQKAIEDLNAAKTNTEFYNSLNAYFDSLYKERTLDDRVKQVDLENKKLDADTRLSEQNIKLAAALTRYNLALSVIEEAKSKVMKNWGDQRWCAYLGVSNEQLKTIKILNELYTSQKSLVDIQKILHDKTNVWYTYNEILKLFDTASKFMPSAPSR